jgi:nitric oxide synthase-interacting protein
MAHSKRNTSLPHFTSYERSLLRSTWGTKRSLISRDSFLPFASCRLCLQPARAPVVACATNGDLFCRECAINDLLAQRQEIKRLEKEREEARKRIAEDEERMLEEARRRDLRDFELGEMGLQGGRKRKASGSREGEREKEREEEPVKAREVEVDGARRRVFEVGGKEMVRVAREEEERLKREVKNEKVWIWQLVYRALLFCGYPDKKLSEMLMIYAGLE